MTLRVAMVAAECEPWAKTGGLADVVDALARALGRTPDAASGSLATPVDVFLPRYRGVPVPASAVAEAALRVPDPLAPDGTTEVRILDVAADGYRLRLVDHPPAFDREGYYDHPDDPWRFGLLAAAALAALARDPEPPDVLHVHDWHTGPAVIARDRGAAAGDPFLRRLAVVLTAHNLAYHGWTPAERLGQLGLAPGDGIVPDGADGLDLLATGIARAELANTVSPGFAAEALTPAFGMGLDGLLRSLGDRFGGIVNGLDADLWNPATDPVIAAPYDAADLAGKARCRADLLDRVGFDPTDDRPVLGLIGRLDPQKGFDLVAEAAPALLAVGARIVVQGSGHPDLAVPFRTLADARPDRVALVERFDREMARRIYAGVDLFLMPSRFEPCGQGQMIALRYGTPPIVRRTGGLADTVRDVDAAPGQGTGFAFDDATADALVGACVRAFGVRDDPAAWAGLIARGMAVDLRWEHGPAAAYLEQYRRAVAIRRG